MLGLLQPLSECHARLHLTGCLDGLDGRQAAIAAKSQDELAKRRNWDLEERIVVMVRLFDCSRAPQLGAFFLAFRSKESHERNQCKETIGRDGFLYRPPTSFRKRTSSTRQEEPMADKQLTAFVTTRKGTCYLTVKIGRQNFHIMRIRNYTIDAVDKRDMRRLHPDTAFDWKKIGQQLAEKREVCRRYRSRRRASSDTARLPRAREPLYAVYDPITRMVYADVPSTAEGTGALLDAVLSIDRTLGTDHRHGGGRKLRRPR